MAFENVVDLSGYRSRKLATIPFLTIFAETYGMRKHDFEIGRPIPGNKGWKNGSPFFSDRFPPRLIAVCKAYRKVLIPGDQWNMMNGAGTCYLLPFFGFGRAAAGGPLQLIRPTFGNGASRPSRKPRSGLRDFRTPSVRPGRCSETRESGGA